MRCIPATTKPRQLDTRTSARRTRMCLSNPPGGNSFSTSELIGTILSGIRALGVRIALDDFGMGYSSLSYLDRYQMDTIKIDRSFVASMLTRQRTMAIVETVVKLGRALDLDIVAEGVEHEAQLQALQAKGCHLVQGYYLGRPLSVDNVDIALTRHSVDGHGVVQNQVTRGAQ